MPGDQAKTFTDEERDAWFGFLTVHSLIARELVRREPDENDGRVLVATLTPLGRRQFAAARRTHLANVRKLFLGPLTAEQRRGLGASWQAILEGLGPDAGRRSARGRRAAGRPRVAAGRS